MPQGGHPDEVSLGPAVSSDHFRRRNSLPNKQHPPAARVANPNHTQRPKSPLARNNSLCLHAAPQTPRNGEAGIQGPPPNRPPDLPVPAQQLSSSDIAQQLPRPRLPQNAHPSTNAPQADLPLNETSSISDHEPPVGFFTARAAESLQSGPGHLAEASAFNPHLESPSIRKTAGVDHTKTKPIGREAVGSAASPAVPLTNFVNPQTDKTRRLGMPGGGASPLQNRGSYKPPSIKRPAEPNGTRSALGDVTAASINGASDDGTDVKRQRVGMDVRKAPANGGMLNV